MANSTTIQILEDGPRNVIVKFEGILDTSDLGSTVVVDPAALSVIDEAYGVPRKLAIKKITYNIEDTLAVNLFWDATSPVRIESIAGRGKMDFWKSQPLQNNAGAGVTGKITATTQGWAATAIVSFSIILELMKQ